MFVSVFLFLYFPKYYNNLIKENFDKYEFELIF